MFSRSAPNPLEAAVVKATDENLTSENWEYILSVCDRVDADPDKGPQNAIAAITKRLQHKNANVQLFALALAEALSKNCGSKVHREIASRSFTQALTKIMLDKSVHKKVRTRTGELIKHWSEDFKSDPSLGLMTDAYRSLKSQGVSVEPPSKPGKREITDADRRQEEEELQLALAMSLSDTRISQPAPSSSARSQPAPARDIDNGPNAYTQPANSDYTLPTVSATMDTQALAQKPIEERTAATVSRVKALYDFTASEAGELTFRRGDIISVIESAYKDWWRGSLHGVVGIFPTNYVENLPDPTPAELAREAEEELKVFAAAKNVERLLSVLSSADINDPRVAEDEQLQNLYHSTISIRPKLVRLIETYAQRKDELILLNEKFMKARRDYDDLMEASLAQYNTSYARPPPAGAHGGYGRQSSYGQPSPGLDQRQPSYGQYDPQRDPRNSNAPGRYPAGVPPAYIQEQRSGSHGQQLYGGSLSQPPHGGEPDPMRRTAPNGVDPYGAGRMPSNSAQGYSSQQQFNATQPAQPQPHAQAQQPRQTYAQPQQPTYQQQYQQPQQRQQVQPLQQPLAATPSSPSQELARAFPSMPSTQNAPSNTYGSTAGFGGNDRRSVHAQPAQQHSSTAPRPSSPLTDYYAAPAAAQAGTGEQVVSRPKSRTASFDHARAEREGGPPIAYYSQGDDDDAPPSATDARNHDYAAPQQIDPVHSTYAAQPHVHAHAAGVPSAPPADDDDDAAYYYTGAAAGDAPSSHSGAPGGGYY